ncbi:MAG: sterol desaturase family protein, partial [Bdellovibrionales bacterium]|nr:sterol desaturase family protein [Bdellovibrionales bacterium]
KNRWFANLSLTILNVLVVKLILPTGLITLAVWSQKNSFGLFNLFIPKDQIAHILLSILAMDLLIYIQHLLSHKVKLLWRFHKVHHLDVGMDVTTALRFHPIEIILSLLYKSFFIIMLGISPNSIIIFEVILNTMAMFNHSNIFINKRFDKYLKYFIVTPSMHLIHHSVIPSEYNTNYSFNLSIWDRIFKTYLSRNQGEIKIGLNEYKGENISLVNLLLVPIKKARRY